MSINWWYGIIYFLYLRVKFNSVIKNAILLSILSIISQKRFKMFNIKTFRHVYWCGAWRCMIWLWLSYRTQTERVILNLWPSNPGDLTANATSVISLTSDLPALRLVGLLAENCSQKGKSGSGEKVQFQELFSFLHFVTTVLTLVRDERRAADTSLQFSLYPSEN